MAILKILGVKDGVYKLQADGKGVFELNTKTNRVAPAFSGGEEF